MINQSFCLSLLIFWDSQYNASAFLPVATYQGVRANAARGKVFSKRALRYNSPLKLDDNPDGSKLENLAYLSNATVTTKNDATNSHDTPEDLEEGQDAEFSAVGLGRSNWTRNFYEYANAAAGTLGDIMSRKPEDANDPNTASSSTFTTADGAASGVPPPSGGLVTTAIPSGSLASRFGVDHPLDRMALTANGNLQRLVSSYYDAPVQVVVDACDKILLPHNSDGDGLVQNKDNDKTDAMAADNDSIIHRPYAVQTAKQWDRVVHLSVHNQTFCTAHSVITVHDPICQELVESGEIGIGQLFRYLDILPEFELHNAGLHPKDRPGGFWREYTLRCAELSCDIREDFRPGMWDIKSIPSTSSAL